MDTRVGYPNEHLAGDSDSETTSPMYATAVGLVLNSLENQMRASEMAQLPNDDEVDDESESENKSDENPVTEVKEEKVKNRFFDKWAEKFKEFLDNAE
jgi:cell division protein FtsA